MLMESLVKFCSPPNISGSSPQSSVAAFSLTAEEDQILFRNIKKQISLFGWTFPLKFGLLHLYQLGTYESVG